MSKEAEDRLLKLALGIRNSEFGFLSDFGLRVSDLTPWPLT
jgi:hypothetical protein